jgi:hypothetical protein
MGSSAQAANNTSINIQNSVVTQKPLMDFNSSAVSYDNSIRRGSQPTVSNTSQMVNHEALATPPRKMSLNDYQ